MHTLFIQCKKKDGLYIEERTRVRQWEELSFYTKLGESYNLKKLNGERLQNNEDTILKKLRSQCIHPQVIGCNGVPMGFLGVNVKNNVYTSSPSDILHCFLADIIRNGLDYEYHTKCSKIKYKN